MFGRNSAEDFADPVGRRHCARSTLNGPWFVGQIENISRQGGPFTVSAIGIL